MATNELRSADDLLRDAMDLGRKAYWQHVRELAEDVISEAKSGELGEGESAREALQEYIHSTIDGDGWVIYTAKAQMVLLVSDNDGAYLDSFGPDGMADRDGLNWSALAFAALEADLYEQLDARGLDVNSPESWKDIE